MKQLWVVLLLLCIGASADSFSVGTISVTPLGGGSTRFSITNTSGTAASSVLTPLTFGGDSIPALQGCCPYMWFYPGENLIIWGTAVTGGQTSSFVLGPEFFDYYRSIGYADSLNGSIGLWIFGPSEIDLSYGRKLIPYSSGITSPLFPGDTVIGGGGIPLFNADRAQTVDIAVSGTVIGEVPEPGTFLLLAPTLVGLCYKRLSFNKG